MQNTTSDIEASLLRRWFPDPPQAISSLGQFDCFLETDLRDISDVLRRLGHVAWARVPRIYTVLRLLDRLNVIHVFLEQGISDVYFPFTHQTLPQSLDPAVAHEFLQVQRVVLSGALDLERDTGRHRHFSSADHVPFIKVEELGKGAYGYVSRVVSTISHKEYALKVIARGRTFQRNKQILRDFERELGALKKLGHHRHIVQLIGSYTDPRFVGIIMSPVAECDLKDFLESCVSGDQNNVDSRISLSRSFFGCLASALSSLHDNTIRHKDIKPQNILILREAVYLTDFGISLDWSEIGQNTTTGPTIKTARYCAPEVLACEPRNASSDLWSLGCILLEIWTVLKGESVGNLHAFLETHETKSSCYQQNMNATFHWMKMLEKRQKLTDNPPLDWIRHLLIHNKGERWTARQLLLEIEAVNSNPDIKFAFSGQCCIEELGSAESEVSSNTSFHGAGTVSEPLSTLTLLPRNSDTQSMQSSVTQVDVNEKEPNSSYNKFQLDVASLKKKSDDSHLRQRPILEKFDPQAWALSDSYKGSFKTQGTVGLKNLGNTGWMNSILQCICRIEELGAYFLQHWYKQDINVDNPLGYGGAIAMGISSLLEVLCSKDGPQAYAPKKFKEEIGRANPMYAGYDQQDAQEFLAFILDALHEDLNRVKRKPYIETPESNENTINDAEAIKVLGNAVRVIHKARNDSVVMDLMNGFYKVIVTCITCNTAKITFDPYSMISLLIPMRKLWKHTIRFVPLYGKLWDVEVNLEQNRTIKHLKEYIALSFNVQWNHLMVSEIYSNRFYRHFLDGDTIQDMHICPRDEIYVYELDGDLSNQSPTSVNLTTGYNLEKKTLNSAISFNHQILVPIFHRVSNTKPYTVQEWVLRLWPSFILINRKEAKHYGSILKKVLYKVFQMSTCSTFNQDLLRPDGLIPHEFRQLFDMKYMSANDEVTPTGWTTIGREKSFGSVSQRVREFWRRQSVQIARENQNESDETLIRPGESIILEWTIDGFNGLFAGESSNGRWGMDVRKSVSKFRNEKLQFEAHKFEGYDNIITLERCLKETYKPEVLSTESGWYCSHCKELRSARKKLDIWSAPEILIIHLKRYGTGRSAQTKIDACIEFPIQGLDLTDNVKLSQGKKVVYDLFAVVNHYHTSPGVGVYTAFAKNVFDKEWYEYNDSTVRKIVDVDRVVSSAAYILFYRRCL